MSEPDSNSENGLQQYSGIYIILAAFSVAFVTIFALILSQTNGLWAAIGIGIEVFLAALTGGAALGFLFAIPRLLSQPAENDPAKSVVNRARLQTNTNLERISDWLTTMLVGVGLSQIHNLNTALGAFRIYIAETTSSLGSKGALLPAAAPLVLIIGSLIGFIAMYIYTRTELTKIFNRAEGDLLRGDVRRAVVGAAIKAESEGSTRVSNITDSKEVTVDDGLDLMFDLLYKPGGYDCVITLAATLQSTEAVKKANYWFYLAAAFGQKLTAAIERDDSAEASSARDNALDAARRAIRLDRAYKIRLWNISNPDSTDNDLAALREDSEFLSLVGQKAI